MITIIRKKQGMKSLIKKLVELQHFSTSAGIHTNEGKRKAFGWNGKKKKINIATLARVLETFASWIQPNTVTLKGDTGEYVTILKGARLTRPARYFISLFEHSETWIKFKNMIYIWAKELIIQKSGRPRLFIKRIGDLASSYQKALILSNDQDKNSQITVKLKGFNAPLQRLGILYNSVKSKVYNKRNGLAPQAKKDIKIEDANLVDKIISEFNRKGK